MTAQEFFENYVLPIMAERQDAADGYEDTYIGVIKNFLEDCRDIENTLRDQELKDCIKKGYFTLSDAELVKFKDYQAGFVELTEAELEKYKDKRRFLPVTADEISEITADDTIPYHTELLTNCINYGVAYQLIVDEAGDEANTFISLKNDYDAKRTQYNTVVYEDISLWRWV